jgi:hypothetical protein
MGQFTLYIELLNEITKFTYTHVLNYSCLCEKNHILGSCKGITYQEALRKLWPWLHFLVVWGYLLLHQWALTFSSSCPASDARSTSSQLARLLLQE